MSCHLRVRRGLGLLALLSAVCSAPAANASEDDPPFKLGSCAEPNPSNALEADLGSGVLGVGYERRVLPELSLRTTFQLNVPWYTDLVGGPDTDARGLALELRPFIFPFGSGLKGWYVSPFGRLGALAAQDQLPEQASGVGWSAGATVGYGWLFNYEQVLLRLGAGAQYWDFEVTKGGATAGVTGFYPDLDLMLGWAF